MTIKLIACDMDGTFLRTDGTYDTLRFQTLYEEMKRQKIHFVVASGNPLIQLQASFEDIKDELIFISENGGYIVDKGKELQSSSIDEEDVLHTIQMLKTLPDVLCWVCTKHQSYTLTSIADHYHEMFLPYFPGVKKIDDFSLISEPITKFALYLPTQNVEELIHNFCSILSDGVSVVDSGHSCVDVIPSHVNKGIALTYVMDYYQITSKEVMAFGDAGNDKEMLDISTYGYVMNNAIERFKSRFDYVAPANDEDGVLQVMEDYLMHHHFMNRK